MSDLLNGGLLAWLALLTLAVTWTIVGLKTIRSRTISRALKLVPEGDRKALLINEYGYYLKEGMSSGDFLRAQRNSLIFNAFLAVAATVVVLAVLALIRSQTNDALGALLGLVPSKTKQIQSLVLELKSDDQTIRRHAESALLEFGSDAAPELVKTIGEESEVVAAEMLGRGMSGNFGDLFSMLLGSPPWQTPFVESATSCLVRIGQPAVPHILEQLGRDSTGVERLMADAQQLEARQHKTPQQPNVGDALGQWGFLLQAGGQTTRIAITRDILSRTLVEIGAPAVPDLLDALSSPRLLVRITSLQVLVQIPGARQPTVERLERLAESSQSPIREEYLSAIRQLKASVAGERGSQPFAP